MTIKRSGGKVLSCVGCVFSFLLVSQEIQAQADFFKGKTITIIGGTRPGGTADMRIRSVVPFLKKHIPGRPTVVVEFMPGAGGRKAANYIYNTARSDGLTIAALTGGVVSSAVLGLAGVNYDVDKLIYLGSGNSRTSYVFITRSEAGMDGLEKLRAASGLRVGAQAVGHPVYIVGRLFAWILPLKEPKFVTGYSGPELDLAVVRGEVDARINITDTVVDRSPEWIEKGVAHFHAVLEIPKGFRREHPAFTSLPSFESLTRTDAQRRALAMFRNFRLIGSPFVLPPGVPKERIEILKEGFRKTFEDPEFLKEFRKLTGAPATPLLPQEQEQAVREIPRDPETAELFNRIAGADPLPPS